MFRVIIFLVAENIAEMLLVGFIFSNDKYEDPTLKQTGIKLR